MREAYTLNPTALGAFAILLSRHGQARAGTYDDVLKVFHDHARPVESMATRSGYLSNFVQYRSTAVRGMPGLYPVDQDNPGTGVPGCPEEMGYKAPALSGCGNTAPEMQTAYNPGSDRIVDMLEIPNRPSGFRYKT